MVRRLLPIVCLFVGIMFASQAKAAGILITRAYYLTPTKTSVYFSGSAWLGANEYSPWINKFWSVSSNTTTNRTYNAFWADVDYSNGNWEAKAAIVPYVRAATVNVSMLYFRNGIRYSTVDARAVR